MVWPGWDGSDGEKVKWHVGVFCESAMGGVSGCVELLSSPVCAAADGTTNDTFIHITWQARRNGMPFSKQDMELWKNAGKDPPIIHGFPPRPERPTLARSEPLVRLHWPSALLRLPSIVPPALDLLVPSETRA
jgi:hypothetical protein